MNKQTLEMAKMGAIVVSLIASGATMIIDSKLADIKLAEFVSKGRK